MSLDQLTQEGDDPAYTNRFFSGTLPTPTGKIANFLNQLSQEDQVTTAGHLFQVLKDSAGEKLFQLNAPGNTTQPLAALVMFPESSKVRLVYGPELGMARIGSSSDLQDKLLWLMNEMEDNGASPQALVLPEEYVVSTNTMGRDTNLFKAATKTQLEKPSFAHSDTDNVEWEVMRIAPIPAYLALDAIKNPVEAADILERLENVHAPVGNPANMLQHLKKFLLTAWVKHNQKKSARLESTDFMAGYSADATAWARGKTTQMFPQQQTPATPTTGMDAVLIQQLLLQNQGLVQQLQSPPQPATTTKEEKSWSESEVKRILTMCGKAHKNTFEDNIKELPPIFREVQKERNKALQVALVKEQLDGNKHFKDAPSPNNPELYDVLRKREFFSTDSASSPSIGAAFKNLSLFLCIRLSQDELELVEHQREILDKTEAKTSADIAKSLAKGVPIVPEAFHDFVEGLRMFANVLHAYFGEECPLFKRIINLIASIMGFETNARSIFDHNQKATILWLTFLEGRAFAQGKGNSVPAFDHMLNTLCWKIGRVSYAQVPAKLLRKSVEEEKKEEENTKKRPTKPTGDPPRSPEKIARVIHRAKCLKEFDAAVEKVKKAQDKEHINITAICKACSLEIPQLFEEKVCANYALYGKCTRFACRMPHKDLSEKQAKYTMDKLAPFLADPVQVMG